MKLEDKKQVKTITKRLDEYGFRELKIHTSKGTAYRLTINDFKNIITPYFPTLSTLSTLLEDKDKNKMYEGVGNEKIMKKKNVGNEGNEGNVAVGIRNK